MSDQRDERRAGGVGSPARARICVRCGERMEERKCKVICPNCGALDDCSDP